MIGRPFAAAIGAMVAQAMSIADSKGAKLAPETTLQIVGLMSSRQRSRHTLNAKGTRVWRDRAHRTAGRRTERRLGKVRLK